MSASPRPLTRKGSDIARFMAGISAGALVLGSMTIAVAAPEVRAAEAPTSSETVSLEPSVSEVEFVPGTVAAGYTEEGPVPEEVGDYQQLAAVTAVSGDSPAEEIQADPEDLGASKSDTGAEAVGPDDTAALQDRAARAIAGEVDVDIARADLAADNAMVAVTWDRAEVQPESIHLRYLLDGNWSEWTALEVADGGEDPEVPGAVSGTEPFSVFFADSVEVVALSGEGETIPGLSLVIVDAESDGEIANALAALGEEHSPSTTVEEGAPDVEAPGLGSESDGGTVGEGDSDSPVGDNGEPESELDQEATEGPVTDDENDPSSEEPADTLLDLEGAAIGDGASFAGEPTALRTVVPTALNAAGTVFDTGYQGLKINTRKAWGANEALMTWTPKANNIKGAVIHHTESSNNYTQAQVAQQIRNIYEYHAVKLGWGDIGYNLIVDRFGGVWEGRAGGLTKMIHGAHAGNANGSTFGITVMGSYSAAAPIAAAQDSLAKTIAWKLQLHGITNSDTSISVLHQSGKYVTVPLVSGHRDVGWTDCPGDALYRQLGAIRTKVSAYLKSGSGSTESGGSATSGLPTTFSAANVISDALFYDSGAMTEAQIRALIQSAGKDCKPGTGTTCLKDTTFPTTNLKTLRGGCKPLTMSGNQSPWTIIKKTADACGLNPQVVLTTLQKEQSGLTQPKSAATWAKAMGSGCPDNSSCDAAQGGFQKQVYYGADKLVSYKLKSQAGHVDAFKAGKAMTVLHNPDTKCGSQSVKFANVATASLYEYTPYIGSSSVSGCATIGQKSFYDIYKRYFPETVGAVIALKAPTPTISGIPFVGVTLTAVGAGASKFAPGASAVSYQWLRGGTAIKGATGATYAPTSADVGKAITVKVTGSKTGYKAASATSKAVTVRGSIDRLGGADRIATNVVVNSATMKAGKPLFVATSNDYADALTVGPAVKVSGGSLMLTKPNFLSAASASLLKSKKPSVIYVIGGEGAVSDNVMAQLKAAVPGVNLARVSGSNRYQTSVAVAEKFFGNRSVTTAFIATGRDFPDALSASSVAGALNAPVLLVAGQASTISSSTRAFLDKKAPKTVVITGGTGVVSTGIESSLRAAHKGTVRKAGADRYATNQELNKYRVSASGTTPKTMWVATGADFPDALSAAVPAAAATSSLVLSNGRCLPKPTVSTGIAGASSKVTAVKLVGGAGVLSDAIAALTECK